MMAEGETRWDVPDTLWIGGVSKDCPITKDRALFRSYFTDWMLPNRFEIVEIKFLTGNSLVLLQNEFVVGHIVCLS